MPIRSSGSSAHTGLGSPIPPAAKALREDPEKIRDESIHGREVDDPPLRKAIQDVLQYFESFNAFALKTGGFEPCGDMRGITGASGKLSKDTTRWILKGLELPIK